MVTVENGNPDDTQEQAWENPANPKDASDDRDNEQVQRQYEEAKRRKDNLTEKDHIDKEKKQTN